SRWRGRQGRDGLADGGRSAAARQRPFRIELAVELPVRASGALVLREGGRCGQCCPDRHDHCLSVHVSSKLLVLDGRHLCCSFGVRPLSSMFLHAEPARPGKNVCAENYAPTAALSTKSRVCTVRRELISDRLCGLAAILVQ